MPKKVNLDKQQYTKEEVEAILAKSGEEADDQLEVLKLESGMNDAERTYYKGLDGDAKNNFLYMNSDERGAVLKNAADQNPVVYTAADGRQFRKNDNQELVAMARKHDSERAEDRAALAKLLESREADRRAAFIKEHMVNIAGDDATKQAMLKAIESIADATVRSAALDALKAQNAQMFKAFNELGTVGDAARTMSKGSATAEMDAKAKEYMAKNAVDYFKAYAAVAEAEPVLYAKAVNGQ